MNLLSNMLKKISSEYFSAFQKKEIIKIAEMLSLDISLSDWEFSANGLVNVIEVYKEIFGTISKIEVRIINLVSENSFVFAELQIVINNVTTLKVVDVLEYDCDLKIKSIRAYKR